MKILPILCLISLSMLSDLRGQYRESEWEYRDSWMDVPALLSRAGVETGDLVADIGCNEGYLSMHLAARVGESGKVYAVDIRQIHLEALQANARERGYGNIRTLLGEEDNPKLPKTSLDVVFIIDSYHEMDSPAGMLAHVKKALKSGGRLVILEKIKAEALHKSREEQAELHTLSLKYVRNELEEAGFLISMEYRDLGPWENEEDKTMWMLIARTPDSPGRDAKPLN